MIFDPEPLIRREKRLEKRMLRLRRKALSAKADYDRAVQDRKEAQRASYLARQAMIRASQPAPVMTQEEEDEFFA
jgi:hypothetical protein